MKELTKKEREAKIRNKELAIIKASNQLLEESKQKMIDHGGKDELEIDNISKDIDEAINDNERMAKEYYNVTMEEVNSQKYGKPSKESIRKYEERLKKRGLTDEEMHRKSVKSAVNSNSLNVLADNSDEEAFEFEKQKNVTTYNKVNQNKVKTFADNNNTFDVSQIPSNVQYDVIPLPSRGQCYSHKKDRVPVAYLTASDENLITSPNLYRDGKVIDLILGRKILDKSIDPNTLCKGDRDAILLWLRATGYGKDFPITVHDPELDTDYDVTVDLSEISVKDFNLSGDENGWFDYKTGNGDEIKYTYLNRYDENVIKDTLSVIAANARREKIIQESQDLMKEVKNDELLLQKDKTRLQNACAGLYKWGKTLTVLGGGETYGQQMTLTMALSIKSINGNTDRDYINDYVSNMRAQEAYDFRNYMSENTPGMDFSIIVTRPESDGGGSFETFLELDSLLFLRLPKVRRKS